MGLSWFYWLDSLEELRFDRPELRMIKRADPTGCGCTDCLTGFSGPFSSLNEAELQGLRDGVIQDSTSGEFEDYIEELRAKLKGFSKT